MRRLLRKLCGVRSRYDTDGSRGAVLLSDVYVCVGKKSAGFESSFFFRRDFRTFWKRKFPVPLASVSEPAFDGEWRKKECDGN